MGEIPDDIFGGPLTYESESGPEAEPVTIDDRLKAITHNPQTYHVASVLPARAPGSVGRPAAFPPYVWLIFAASIAIFGSARSAAAHLRRPLWWGLVKDGVAAHLGEDAAAALPTRGPTRSQWNYFRTALLLPNLDAIQAAFEDGAVAQAIELGLLDGEQSRSFTDPPRSQVLHGDATVTLAASSHTEPVTVDPDTGEIRRHRIDPDAVHYIEGDGTRVYGNKYVSYAVRAAKTAHSRIIIAVSAARTVGTEGDAERGEECEVAVADLLRIAAKAPGLTAFTYDKAIRGVHRAPLIRAGLLVFNKQHEGIKPRALQEHITPTCRHALYTADGRVCERMTTANGTDYYQPLPILELASRGNRTRWYHELEIPCRHGHHKIRVPVYETSNDRARGFNRTEHLRQIPPSSRVGRKLVGYREDAESQHSRLDAAFPFKRMPAYGLNAGLLIYLGFALAINALTRAMHPRGFRRHPRKPS